MNMYIPTHLKKYARFIEEFEILVNDNTTEQEVKKMVFAKQKLINEGVNMNTNPNSNVRPVNNNKPVVAKVKSNPVVKSVEEFKYIHNGYSVLETSTFIVIVNTNATTLNTFASYALIKADANNADMIKTIREEYKTLYGTDIPFNDIPPHSNPIPEVEEKVIPVIEDKVIYEEEEEEEEFFGVNRYIAELKEKEEKVKPVEIKETTALIENTIADEDLVYEAGDMLVKSKDGLTLLFVKADGRSRVLVENCNDAEYTKVLNKIKFKYRTSNKDANGKNATIPTFDFLTAPMIK